MCGNGCRLNKVAKNPVMVRAGQKAWATRRANVEAKATRLTKIAKKVWVTRRANTKCLVNA